MGLPPGYKYLKNMAIYPQRSKAKAYLNDYGENLESKYDMADKTTYKKRIFCLDCLNFKKCKYKWKNCPLRAKALKIMKEEL